MALAKALPISPKTINGMMLYTTVLRPLHFKVNSEISLTIVGGLRYDDII